MDNEPMFVTWKSGDENSRIAALQSMAKGMAKLIPITKNQSKGSTIYKNIGPGNNSIRDSFTRDDYEEYRPDEIIPKTTMDKIRKSQSLYKHNGIARNFIDLMSDFVVQGIDVEHPNPKVKAFYKKWFKKVKAEERSERFASTCFKSANVIIKRFTGILPLKKSNEWKQSTAKPDIKLTKDEKPETREIPLKYRFLNPLSLTRINSDLDAFLDIKPRFALKISEALYKSILHPSDEDKEFVSQLPTDIVALIKGKRKKVIPLDPSKISVFYFKKDDDEAWATPILASVFPDFDAFEKMRLADMSALDGAITAIRVWKLGDLENQIMPTEAGVNKLADILLNAVGGGVVDIIWGPAINLIETKTDLHNFLGSNKYTPILNNIRVGLGIPSILVMESGRSGGFTNNFIELKVLTERLEYVRNLLKEFWQEEIELVRQAMGFEVGAQLVFDRASLTDEVTQLQLLMALADRNIISDEMLQERIGAVPEVERIRIQREWKSRQSGRMPPESDPFHNAQQKDALERIALQTGVSTPKDFGINTSLNTTKDGAIIPKGQPGQGRPVGLKDKQKRKQKRVGPRTKARIKLFNDSVWADNTQKKIAEIVHPIYLKSLSKENIRQLTDVEFDGLERFKFALLCETPCGMQFDEQHLQSLCARNEVLVPAFADKLLQKVLAKYRGDYTDEPPIEQVRRFQSWVRAFMNVS